MSSSSSSSTHPVAATAATAATAAADAAEAAETAESLDANKAIEQATRLSNNVETSYSDNREYRHITLPTNQLKVLLVSDPTTQKAAASMSVGVGHFSDPDELPGLAHFLEHMLFLGTEKFPDENDYNSYLSDHGGMSNAFTAFEETTYMFDVQKSYLKGALERFASFFTCPLFTESATGRELNAVDSEHHKNLQDDGWRLFQLEKSTSSKDHPYSKFATGDSSTLDKIPKEKGINVRQALIDFHAKHYSANRMGLAVLGSETLDDLEASVRELFKDVPNNNSEFPKLGGLSPFHNCSLPRVIYAVPVKDLKTIDFTWALPSMKHAWQTAPYHYISQLVGHEGPGSILAYLKEKGWANELSAGLTSDASDFAFFGVSVECTEVGIEQHREDIIEVVLSYLNMLRDHGPDKRHWQELATQLACDLRFKNEQDPFGFVVRASSNLLIFPPKYTLTAKSLVREYDPDGIKDMLAYLNPKNVQIISVHSSYKDRAVETEPVYGTSYTIEPISPETVANWEKVRKSSNELHEPVPNEFLPTDFTIRKFVPPTPVDSKSIPPEAGPTEALIHGTKMNQGARPGPLRNVTHPWTSSEPFVPDGSTEKSDTRRPPTLIRCDERARVFFKQDTYFKRPKVSVSVAIRSPVAYESVEASALAELWTMLLRDELQAYAYAATISGLHFSVSNSVFGLTISVGGFGHKLPVLLRKIIDTISAGQYSQQHFERFKARLIQNYQNFAHEQSYQHALYTTSFLVNEPRWHMQEKLKVAKSFTLEKLDKFVPRMLGATSIDLLAHGNLTPQEALSISEMTVKGLAKLGKPLRPSERPVQRVVSLPTDEEKLAWLPSPDPENSNSAIEHYLQIGPETPELLALTSLFENIAQEPCFNTLRTEEQLGYIVHLGVRSDFGIVGIRIVVQSSRADPVVLDERIEAFLVKLRGILASLTKETFDANIESLETQLLDFDKTLFQEGRRWWGEIESEMYDFNRSLEIVVQLRLLSQQHLLDFFDKYIAADAPLRKKLAVGVFAANHQVSFPDLFGSNSTAGSFNESSGESCPSDDAKKNEDASQEPGLPTFQASQDDKATLSAASAVSTSGSRNQSIVKDIFSFRSESDLYPPRSRTAMGGRL